jgi:hypothetical protein
VDLLGRSTYQVAVSNPPYHTVKDEQASVFHGAPRVND